MIDQFLQNKSHIIINTDLDGIFSGLLLQKYSHLSVAGLCNSRDSIWLRDDVDSNDCVIVDMYVPSMACIDQHIISIDQPHGASILASGKTLNPNLFRDRYFIDPLSYRTKFPFSTTMYLVSLLDVDTQWFDDGGRAHGASSRDLFFRADDVLKICIDSPYTKNVSDWWPWLESQARNPAAVQWTRSMIHGTGSDEVGDIRRRTEIFSMEMGCSRPDGFMTDAILGNRINDVWRNFVSTIGRVTGLGEIDFSGTYNVWRGRPHRYNVTENNLEELRNTCSINGNKIISYAFVRAPFSSQNLSVTHEM